MKRVIVWMCTLMLPALSALSQDQRVVVDVNLVQVAATVEDQKGRPVINLDAADFELLEDGTPREIHYFSHDDQRLAVGFVVDRSVSLDKENKKVDETLSDLIAAAGPDDEAFLVTFAGENKLSVTMTTNKHKILKAARRTSTSYGTRFYDAIVSAAEYLCHTVSDRKALIVLSDGADHASSHTLEDALALAGTSGIEIYVVRYAGDDPLVWTKEGREQIRRAFSSLADGSGGQSFFPQSGDEIAGISAHIMQRLRHQYRFGFYSAKDPVAPGRVELRLRNDEFNRFSVHLATPSRPEFLSQIQ